MEDKETRTKQIVFRVSEEEIKVYKEEAKKRFMTMTELIRYALHKMIGKQG
jgi:predicted DNA binding CopG/RHH family protein